MLDLSRELRNVSNKREIDVSLRDLFPQLDEGRVWFRYARLRGSTDHATLLMTALHLSQGGYQTILDREGFWDPSFKPFSGHCHQSTPVLGLVLKTLGFEVSYLECKRIQPTFAQTGLREIIEPHQEPNPETRAEFIRIGRIPYCCLEVKIDGQPLLVSGKHIRSQGGGPVALLRPECYSPFTGVFRHQDDQKKSGVYLATVTPLENSHDSNAILFPVWKKQTYKDPEVELFSTYLRMNLVS